MKRFQDYAISILLSLALTFGINYLTNNSNKLDKWTEPQTTASDYEKQGNQHKQRRIKNSKINLYRGQAGESIYDHTNISVYNSEKQNKKFDKLLSIALKEWNKNQTIHFYLSNNPKSDVRVKFAKFGSNTDGLTSQWDFADNNSTAYALVKIDWNKFIKDNYTIRAGVNVIEHELGHAIGLGHTKHYSIMRTNNNKYGLSKYDSDNVKRLYKNIKIKEIDKQKEHA